MDWKPLLDVDGLPSCMSWALPRPDDDIESWQDGRCAMCRCTKDVDLVTDHDHYTGLIRGLLCRGCNTLEARKGHWPVVAAWRAGRNPATIMGLEQMYHSSWGGSLSILDAPHVPEYRNGVLVASLAAAKILDRPVGARILNR